MTYPWVRDANRIFMWVLPMLFVIGLVIAGLTDTWLIAILIGLPIVAVPMAMITLYPDAQITRIIVGVSVQLITALHIHQSAGLTEVHFQIFVLLAFLVFYRDWKVIAASTAVVAVHHIGFYVLQMSGVGVFVVEAAYASFGILLVHAFYALVEGGVLMYVAYRNQGAAIAAMTLTNSLNQILADPEKVNLSIQLDHDNPQNEAFNNFITSIRDLITQTHLTNLN